MFFTSIIRFIALSSLVAKGFAAPVAKPEALDVAARDAAPIAAAQPFPISYDEEILKRDGLLGALGNLLNGILGNGIDGLLPTVNSLVKNLVSASTSCDGILNDLGAVLDQALKDLGPAVATALNDVADILKKIIAGLQTGLASGNLLLLVGDLLNAILIAVGTDGSGILADVGILLAKLLEALTMAKGSCVGTTVSASLGVACSDGSIVSAASADNFNAEGILGDVAEIVNDAVNSLTSSNLSGILGDVLTLVTKLIEDLTKCDGLLNDLGADLQSILTQAGVSVDAILKEVAALLSKLIADLVKGLSGPDILNDLSNLLGYILHDVGDSAEDILNEVGDLLQKLLKVIANGSSKCSIEAASLSASSCASATSALASATGN